MAVISSPEMRAVEREMAREFAAQAKLRTVAAIRKERARSHTVLLDADEKIEAYVAYTLDWATGLEDISPTRLFADGKRIAAFFLGSRKKYERQVYGDDMTPRRPRPGALKGVGDGKTNRKASRKAQETAHIRATWV